MTREKQEERVEENSKRMERETIEDMDWVETPDPEIELARNFRSKEADLKKGRALNRYSVKNVVLEIVVSVVPLSTTNNIIDILLVKSVRVGRMELLWKEMAEDDRIKDDIRKRIEEEDEAKIKDALDKARSKRLEVKEEKIKMWKERSKMMNLIKEMDSLNLETFDGKWKEHDLMDERMLEILVDDYDICGGDEMETSQQENEDDEDGMEDAEIYEDWLDNELSFMMVDEDAGGWAGPSGGRTSCPSTRPT